MTGPERGAAQPAATEAALVSKCDVGVLRELASWSHARGAGAAGPEVEERTIDVFVTFAGDPAALRDAGMFVGDHDGEVATGTVRLADVERLDATAGVTWVSLAAPVHTQIDRSMHEIRALQLRANAPPYTVGGAAGLTGEGVLVGVIDDMISEFHPSFIKPGTNPQLTRLVAIWDQKSAPAPGQHAPPGFPYGVHWDEAAINDVLKRRDLHAIRLTAELDHGSHVTGIAAGNGAIKDSNFAPFTFVGVAPQADLAFCNGAFSSTARVVADALKFIFRTATDRGQPCVVNMSFGTHEGARDGSSDLERAIDRVMHDAQGNPLPGRAVVVAAGNEGDPDVIRRHGRKLMAPGGNLTFRLEVSKVVFPIGDPLTADLIDDRMYIWYDGAASIDLRLTPARSTPSGWTKPGQTSVVSVRGTPVATIASAAQPHPVNGKRRIEISLPAPVRLGDWLLELHETAGAAATVDLWVDRLGDRDIWPRLAFGDNVIDNTVTSPNTSRSVISVGAYTSEPNFLYGERYGELCKFSSRGLDDAFGVPDADVRPHLVAPGRRIISANRSPFIEEKQDYFKLRFDGWTLAHHALMNGTSQAAPHVTGVVALMLQRNPSLTYVQIRDILTSTAKKDQMPPQLRLPDGRWGYGKLDAKAALDATPAGGPP